MYKVGDKVVLVDGYDIEEYDENPELEGKVLTVREAYGAYTYSQNLHFEGFGDDPEDVILNEDVRYATDEEIEADMAIYKGDE